MRKNRAEQSEIQPSLHFATLQKAGVLAVFLGLALAVQGAVPTPEKLLPDDTLILLTAPDYTRLRGVLTNSPQAQLWSDPAMKAFKEKLVSKWE